MNKMDKETSLRLLELERENSKNAPEIIQRLLESIEKAVKADKLTYADFIEDMAKSFNELPKDIDDSTSDKREEIVNNICQKLIDKYDTGNEK